MPIASGLAGVVLALVFGLGRGPLLRGIDALGGRENLSSIDACTTRLRPTVHDQAAVDDAALTQLARVA